MSRSILARIERLERVVEHERTSSILEGEPVQGENLLDWLSNSVRYYMKAGYIDENGNVVPGAVKGLPEGVRERVELASGVIGKLFIIGSAEETLGRK